MNDIEKKSITITPVTTKDVEARMITLRNKPVLIDADVAELYGVQTKEVNQAVRNNRDKFPQEYMFELTKSELCDLRSKILTTNISVKSRKTTKVFTERGLYMLATILKSERAIDTTLAIVDTFVQIRELARTMEALQTVEDGGHGCRI